MDMLGYSQFKSALSSQFNGTCAIPVNEQMKIKQCAGLTEEQRQAR